MRIWLVRILAFALLTFAAQPALGSHRHDEHLLTFEEFATQGQASTPVTNGYGGLRWIGFGVVDGTSFAPTTGHFRGIVSGRNVASTQLSIYSGHRFTLRAAWVTSRNYAEVQFSVIAAVGGVNLSTNTYFVRGTGPTRVPLDLQDIHSARFSVFGFDGIIIDDLEVSSVGRHAETTPGWFRPGPIYFTPAQATSVAVGDINGDSRNDLLMLSTNGLRIELGMDGGALAAQPVAAIRGHFLTVGDYNGDDRTDAIASSPPYGFTAAYARYTNSTSVAAASIGGLSYPGPMAVADFDPELRLVYANSNEANDIAVGDLNGDLLLDYVLAVPGGLWPYRNTGNRTFIRGARLSYSNQSVAGVVAHDFDLDGDLDLATAFENFAQIGIVWNDGQGNFTGWTLHPAGVARPIALAAGDLDGDGILDIVTRSASSSISLLRGLGNRAFAAPIVLAPGGALSALGVSARTIAVNDLNGDGAPDIAFVSGTEIATLINIAPPRLNIGLVTDLVEIYWPTNFAPGAILETATSLGGDAVWAEAAFPPINTDNGRAAYDSGRLPMRFFRLRRADSP